MPFSVLLVVLTRIFNVQADFLTGASRLCNVVIACAKQRGKVQVA
jgi:hypothetical protein